MSFPGFGVGVLLILIPRVIRNAVKNPLRSVREMLPEKITLQRLGKDGFLDNDEVPYLGKFSLPELGSSFRKSTNCSEGALGAFLRSRSRFVVFSMASSLPGRR